MGKGQTLQIEDLPDEIIRPGIPLEILRRSRTEIRSQPRPAEEPSGEAQQILDALEATHWNRNDAAQLLGISRTTLWRKMREYQIGS